MEFRTTKRYVARGARPDAETSDSMYLIKNVSELRATYQIRLLLFRAIQENRKLILDVPRACEVRYDLKALINEHHRHIKMSKN